MKIYTLTLCSPLFSQINVLDDRIHSFSNASSLHSGLGFGTGRSVFEFCFGNYAAVLDSVEYLGG